MRKTIYKNIIKAAIVIAVIIFLFWKIPALYDVLTVVVVSFIIAYALKPAQQMLIRHGLRKKSSAIILLLAVLGIILAIGAVIIPAVSREGQNIADSLGEIKNYYEEFVGGFSSAGSGILGGTVDLSYDRVSGLVSGFASKIINKTSDMAGSILIYLVIPPVTYFFLSDGDRIFSGLMKYLPVKGKYSLRKTGKHIDKVMGRYVVSQFELCGIIGIMTYVVLAFSGIKYPILLSLVNAMFNIIPYFGPLLGALPILIVTLLTSVKKAVVIALWLGAIQQLEGNVISPKILGESVDSHPLTILLLLIIGDGIGGVFGMILIVPVWTMAKMFFTEIEYYLF